jgi:hypothetical protein
MRAFWTEVYVRTETCHRNFLDEAAREEADRRGVEVANTSFQTGVLLDKKIIIADDDQASIISIKQVFEQRENVKIGLIYSAWYQPTLFHEKLDKFKTLDVITEITDFAYRKAGKPGEAVALEVQGIAGEDAQVNLRVHILCEVVGN